MSRLVYGTSGYGLAKWSRGIPDSLTISVWAKLSATTTGTRNIVSLRNSTTSTLTRDGFFLSAVGVGGQQPRVDMAGSVTVIGYQAPTTDGWGNRPGQWVHVLGEFYNGAIGSCTLYTDGVQRGGATPNTAAIPTSVDTIQIGAQLYNNTTVGNYWDGYICEPAVWEGLISSFDIQGLANGESPLDISRDRLAFFAPRHMNASFDYNEISTRTNDPDGSSMTTKYIGHVPYIYDAPPQILTRRGQNTRTSISLFGAQFSNILNFERSPIRGVARGVS